MELITKIVAAVNDVLWNKQLLLLFLHQLHKIFQRNSGRLCLGRLFRRDIALGSLRSYILHSVNYFGSLFII